LLGGLRGLLPRLLRGLAGGLAGLPGVGPAVELAAHDLLVGGLVAARVARRRPVGVHRRTVVVLAALLRSPELARDPVDELLDAAVRLGVALVRDEPLVLPRAVEDRLALPRLVVALEHELDARLGAQELVQTRAL